MRRPRQKIRRARSFGGCPCACIVGDHADRRGAVKRIRSPMRRLAKPKRLGYDGLVDVRQMGRRGGRSRSAAKTAASRRNGALGGRPRDVDRFAQQVREVCARLSPELPGVDPGDLRMIVRCLLLPPARRAVFIARRKDGRYVF